MIARVISKRSWRMPLLVGAVVAATTLLLYRPQAIATGVSRGLSVCTTVIIPSLFPFLVLAQFMVTSGVGRYVGRWLERPTRWLFGLPGCAATAVLLGWVGGYPAGSIATAELLRQGSISTAQAKRLLQFCVCGGPAFVIGAVGVGMLGNRAFGAVLLAAHWLASIVIGVAGRRKEDESRAEIRIQEQPCSVPTALVESVNGACRSMLYTCGFVVLFAAILSLLDALSVSTLAPAIKSAVPILLEVSCGCLEAVSTGTATPLWLGFAIGWGGLSVHCQIAAAMHGEGVIDGGFIGARLVHGALTGIFATVLVRIFPVSITTGTVGNAIVQPFAGSAVSAVALLAVCAMLMMVTENGKTKLKIHIAKRK